MHDSINSTKNKPIRIVCEGPDNTGKSNIGAAISKALNVPLYKSGREADLFYEKDAQFNVLKWGVHEIMQLIETLNASIIFDRFFPSEYAYSLTYDRETDIDLIIKFDKWWANMGGVIIFFDKPALDGSDIFVDSLNYDKLRMRYDTYRKITACKHLYLDTSDRNLDKQVSLILSFLNKE